MSVDHDVCPASNGEQTIARVGRHLQQHIQGLQGERRGLHYCRQACCDVPVQAVTARRAGTARLI